MSTTARKARKKSGVPFVREQKVVTPPAERSIPLVADRRTNTYKPSNRALRRIERLFGLTDGGK